MQSLSTLNSCFAFDSPGFGCSAALTAKAVDICALADALAETRRAMKFPACPVFGSHTGAAIAIELARRHPALTTGLILDGVAMYTPEEQRSLFEGYFAPLLVDELGGHFAQIWTRFRDLFIWFPWNRKAPDNLNEADVPTTERLQMWVSMFYRAAAHYAQPYKSAIAYGSEARAAIASLQTPTVFMAQDTDMLFAHLDRLPPLHSGQSIARVSRAAKSAAIVAAARHFSGALAAPDDAALHSGVMSVARQFLDFPHGQVLVRIAGNLHNVSRAVLLLHDAPGSSLVFEPQMLALSAQKLVIALDLPGSGESAPFRESAPTLLQYALLLADILTRIDVSTCSVYGKGFGSSLAIELARARPQRVHTLVLDGLCLPVAELRSQMLSYYAPSIELCADGSHWYRTWLMLRDSLIYFPWYAGTAESLRRLPMDFDAQRLHDWTFEVVKQLGAYPHLIRAALQQDTVQSFRQVAQVQAREAQTQISVLLDPCHPFAAFSRVAQELAAACGASCRGVNSADDLLDRRMSLT